MSISSVSNLAHSLPAAADSAPSAPAQPVAVPEVKAQAAPPPTRITAEQIQAAIDNVKKRIEPAVSNELEFSIDQDTGKTLVRITDNKTGELIRQIPSEELLAIAKSLDRMQGLFLKQKA